MGSVVQCLWIGNRLSAMEQLCILSFLRNGHKFHLYVYHDTAGIPPGTIVLDGNEILPASRIFTYREHHTYAGFANFFRYKLLFEKGGWFVDADTICLKPFNFRREYVFSSEAINGRQLVNLAVIKVPPGSLVMQYAWEACEKMNISELKWSQCGPTLLRQAVEHYSLQQYIMPSHAFCPLHFSVWEQLLDPSLTWSFGKRNYAIHLWNELWRRSATDKNASYATGCLYELLKKRYFRSADCSGPPSLNKKSG